MSDSLRGGNEDNVITLMLWNKTHAVTLASTVNPLHFSTRNYQKIAQVAVEYITRFGVPPGVHIRDLMERELRGQEGRYVAQIIDASEELQKSIQPDYVMAELDKFIRMRAKTYTLDAAMEALAQGDEVKADHILWDQPTLRPRMNVGVYLHDDDLGFMSTQDTDFYSSGIDELDVRGIRPERGTMTLLIGPKKSGKSWWCINVGKASLQHGHPTLHLTLENSERLTKRRYIQSLFSMTKRQVQARKLVYSEFEKNQYGSLLRIKTGVERPNDRPALPLTLDHQQEIVRRIHSLRTRPRLLIKEWPTGTLTIPQLNAYLDMLERSERFVPDTLIVDYPDLMAVGTEHRREELGVLFQRLRGVAVSRGMALCCPTQGNRTTEGTNLVVSKQVAEDYSKVGVADTVLTYSQTEEERERGLARILVDAARDEEDKFVVLISQQYATGQFCLSSVYMDKAATSVLNRITSTELNEEAAELAAEEADEVRGET